MAKLENNIEITKLPTMKMALFTTNFCQYPFYSHAVKALLCLLLGGVGCAAFGTVVRSNVILSLTASDVRTVEAILALGLLTSDADVSYVLEEWEPLEEVDKSKCELDQAGARTAVTAVIL